jgi:hypothetical protein
MNSFSQFPPLPPQLAPDPGFSLTLSEWRDDQENEPPAASAANDGEQPSPQQQQAPHETEELSPQEVAELLKRVPTMSTHSDK